MAEKLTYQFDREWLPYFRAMYYVGICPGSMVLDESPKDYVQIIIEKIDEEIFLEILKKHGVLAED